MRSDAIENARNPAVLYRVNHQSGEILDVDPGHGLVTGGARTANSGIERGVEAGNHAALATQDHSGPNDDGPHAGTVGGQMSSRLDISTVFDHEHIGVVRHRLLASQSLAREDMKSPSLPPSLFSS